MPICPDGKRIGVLPEVLPFILGGEDYLFTRELKKSSHEVFRRVYMKRRTIEREYETDWQEISGTRIMNFGSISQQIDEKKLNFFDLAGYSLKADNTDGYFAEETYPGSFWNGYFSQYRTLVKVQAGYINKDSELEYPSQTTLFYGILNEEPKSSADNTVSLSFKSLLSVFQEIQASDLLINTVATTTADRFVDLVKNHADSNGVKIFQKYFSATAWNVDTGTASYPNLNTTTAVSGKTVLDFLKQLAETEGRVIYIGADGDFNFKARTGGASSVYHFIGGARFLSEQANTIIGIDDYALKTDKVYNRIRIRYGEADTTTSYAIAGETWAWGDSSSSFKYGVRELNLENKWLSQAQAEARATALLSEYYLPKREVSYRAKFFPSLNLLDRVTVSYQVNTNDSASLWGAMKWGTDKWSAVGTQHNEFRAKDFIVQKVAHNLDQFVTTVSGREA